MYNSTRNCPVNYGFWVVMTCHSCFIDCNKHTALVGACVEAEGTSESGRFLLNLAVNLKLKKFIFLNTEKANSRQGDGNITGKNQAGYDRGLGHSERRLPDRLGFVSCWCTGVPLKAEHVGTGTVPRLQSPWHLAEWVCYRYRSMSFAYY